MAVDVGGKLMPVFKKFFIFAINQAVYNEFVYTVCVAVTDVISVYIRFDKNAAFTFFVCYAQIWGVRIAVFWGSKRNPGVYIFCAMGKNHYSGDFIAIVVFAVFFADGHSELINVNP